MRRDAERGRSSGALRRALRLGCWFSTVPCDAVSAMSTLLVSDLRASPTYQLSMSVAYSYRRTAHIATRTAVVVSDHALSGGRATRDCYSCRSSSSDNAAATATVVRCGEGSTAPRPTSPSRASSSKARRSRFVMPAAAGALLPLPGRPAAAADVARWRLPPPRNWARMSSSATINTLAV